MTDRPEVTGLHIFIWHLLQLVSMHAPLKRWPKRSVFPPSGLNSGITSSPTIPSVTLSEMRSSFPCCNQAEKFHHCFRESACGRLYLGVYQLLCWTQNAHKRSNFITPLSCNHEQIEATNHFCFSKSYCKNVLQSSVLNEILTSISSISFLQINVQCSYVRNRKLRQSNENGVNDLYAICAVLQCAFVMGDLSTNDL